MGYNSATALTRKVSQSCHNSQIAITIAIFAVTAGSVGIAASCQCDGAVAKLTNAVVRVYVREHRMKGYCWRGLNGMILNLHLIADTSAT